MRRYFFIPLFLFLFTGQFYKTYSQDYWFKLNSPTTNFLRSLHFADSLTGWVAGDSGLILYTSNGGLDWIEQQSNTDDNIMDIFFLDQNRGWAVAWHEYISPLGTTILSTTNGGIDWVTEDYREENVFMWAIYFLDTLNGWMGGAPSSFVRTTDGGVNWESANIDSGTFAFFPPLNFDFCSSTYGFASGGVHDIAGVIWKTTNGGDNWSAMDPQYAPPDEIWDLHFFDSLNILGVGGDPDLFGVGIIRSSDAGESWDYFEIGLIGVARSISFRTPLEGWAPVPNSESLIYTTNGGDNWIDITSPDSSSIYDLVITDSLTGYAVGSGGVILKYKYPDITPYVEQGQSLPSEFKLLQNYPNPFNPVTTIYFTVPFGSHVQLIVYDPLGNKVAVLEDSYKQRGSYKTIWNADDLPSNISAKGGYASGIYYYQLKVGCYIDTKKMILLK